MSQELPQMPADLQAPRPPPLSATLEAELGKLQPVAPRQPMRQLALLSLVSLIYAAAMLAMLATRHDLGELPMVWLAGVGLAWLAGFVLPMYFAMVPPDGTVLPRWKPALISALAGSFGFVVLGFAIHPASGTHSVASVEHFTQGLGCLKMGCATALVPIVAGALLLRGSLPVGSRAIAAAIGAGGGSLGGLMLHLHCPVTDTLHVALMHGGVVGVAALLSALLVPRATDLR
ncbi:MAG TPA: NrsF family protein [Kofleriaceae bacterium]|nr:NrsF family protein [Kofleriaceae bacterium]